MLPRINHFDFAGVPFLVLSLPNPQFDGLEVLTPAEREVAMMMLDGLSNRAIAEQRGSSVRTIANQVAAIFRKLGVGSRSELATMSAKSSKFVHPEDLPNANLKQLK